MKNIILFASGGGSNVRAILNYFKDRKDVSFPLIVTNKSRAGVIDIAQEFGIDVMLVDKQVFTSPVLIDSLDVFNPNLIVLAGFLWKIPDFLVEAYPKKIINIHPALLPKYGGQGMFGRFVHEAVVKNKETETGITVHFVNENYDEGTILLQKKIPVSEFEDAKEVAKNVLVLEHEWYSQVIDNLLT